MNTRRGVAQVVFNYLPDQTADLDGAIWRVTRWAEPKVLPVDEAAVRAELLRAVYPWVASGRDGGLADDLHQGREITVLSPSVDGYVSVEPFPLNYRCTRCGRLEPSDLRVCKCGETSWRQFAFVSYHECGKSDTPWIPRCRIHQQVRVDLPRSASTSDLRFECPVCGTETSKGFPFLKCECGAGTIKYNVHRAAVVYAPRSTVIVNPPTQAKAQALRAAGARERVLSWALGGMAEPDPLTGAPSLAAITAQLVESGLPEAAAIAAARVAVTEAGGDPDAPGDHQLDLPTDQIEAASESALHLAYAISGGRMRVDDLIRDAGPHSRVRYEHSYRKAVASSVLAEVELLEDFPVLDAVFGYTRDGQGAGDSTLRPFRGTGGGLRVHGQLNRTEALLFRLDPIAVGRWLHHRGHLGSPPDYAREARIAVLGGAVIPRAGDIVQGATLGSDLLELVHSFSHRVMRRISAFCGIDRDSLSEYLIPLHLAFAIFASSRGDFVLGGLQALFEHDLDLALNDVVAGEHRCALDPGCSSNGSACVACLHVGEPSCRYFNQFLSRDALFGASGLYQFAGS